MHDNRLDAYLSETIRTRIEDAYYARISEQATLENLIGDPDFWENTGKHPAFFSDHGVVHVRDVASQILQVLKTVNGVLIPRRDRERLEGFMFGYGVILAYLHDIGMRDLSAFGRAVHPEFAAQAVYSAELNDVVLEMWRCNSGGVATRLSSLARTKVLRRDAHIVFRELLALSVCHSKSRIPVAVLDDPSRLRLHMQLILSHSLRELYALRHETSGGSPEPAGWNQNGPEFVAAHYANSASESFDWLVDDSPEGRNLVSDVTDTLRALRCADALRHRGTVQKTSAGYEMFASRQTGDSIYALRLGDDRLYLVELPDPLAAGESNIAGSELTVDGNLRISFHRGAHDNEAGLHRSAAFAALTIADFLGDIVDSFWRRSPVQTLKTSDEIEVLLESTSDDPRFTALVQEQLKESRPDLGERIHIVPSLQHVSDLERTRYLAARDVDWDLERRQEVLDQVVHSGQKITDFDLIEGFRHVKLIDLDAGDLLIQADTPSAFVYIPLSEGLRITPLGGYDSVSLKSWIAVGTTGVIRGSVRNADVSATRQISLLVIPKEVYLKHWYTPISLEEFRSILFRDARGGPGEFAAGKYRKL